MLKNVTSTQVHLIWERVLAEAATFGDKIVGGILADDIDLQGHLEKGLYELGAV